PFEVAKDPRVGASDAELREAYTLAKRAHDLLTRAHDAVLHLCDVRTQAETWAGRAPSLKEAARALAEKLSAVEAELITVKSDDPRMFPSRLNTRLATVVTLVEYSDAPPTAALRDLTDNLALRTEMELAKLEQIVASDVAAFNAACRDAGLGAIVPKAGG
ncbi:MAG TPA: hypothetical protein VEA38_05775, partial [Terriglobales bacterium]|nr:hypothetical protein [Terriglobales bacterium]